MDRKQKNRKNSLMCYYTNTDSLLNKRHELKVIISTHKPDVLMITETLPKNASTPPDKAEFAIDNYELYYNHEDSNCHRGVCIYVHQSLKSKRILQCESCPESVWCEINLQKNDTLILGSVYRSPNANPANNETINSFLMNLSARKPTHLLISGDFNYPEINWENGYSQTNEDHRASKFLNTVYDSYLIQHVDQHTHFRSDQEPTLIDLLLTNEEEMVNGIQYLPPLGKSHHSGLLFQYMCYNNPTRNASLREKIYQYHAGKYAEMNQELNQFDWGSVLEGKSAEESWCLFEDLIQKMVEKYVPKRRVRDDGSRPPPWMNNAIREKSKDKWAAYWEMRRNRDDPSRRHYAKIRNQLKWLVRKTVKNYEKSVAAEAKTNPKAFYAYVKSKTKVQSSIPDIETVNGLTKTDTEKAEAMNQFFTSVFTKEDLHSIPQPTNYFKDDALTDIEITEDIVRKKLMELNQNKSAGADNQHPRVLKEIADTIVTPVTIIYNKSLDEGYLPQVWRDANITPIHKKGNKAISNNYRPVSLTSILCKTLESIIKDDIIAFLKKYNLLYKFQHAFIGKRSCTTQILEALDCWTKLLEAGEAIDVVYLDFAKAFDKVPHRRLIKKCEAFGIKGKLLKWLEAFVSGRRQRVSVNGSQSAWSDVCSGVPQGSVIGPILFVMFINDMPNNLSNFVSLFADDTKLFGKSTTVADSESIQGDLHKLQEWSETWNLKFNKEKCQTLYLGKNNGKHIYEMGSQKDAVKLRETVAEKDLGIIVDNELSFNTHITQAVKKANKIVGMIRRTFTFLDEDMFKKLFTSLVRPVIEYGNCVWSPSFQYQIREIENVQRRATKLLPGMYNMDYEDRLKRLNLPSLAFRQTPGDMIETFKYCQGLYEVDKKPFTLMREFNQDTTTRDHGFKIRKEKCKLDVRTNFFGNRVVNLWNSLPIDIVNSPSTNAFKNRLDKHWKNYQFTTDIRNIPSRTNSNSNLIVNS